MSRFDKKGFRPVALRPILSEWFAFLCSVGWLSMMVLSRTLMKPKIRDGFWSRWHTCPNWLKKIRSVANCPAWRPNQVSNATPKGFGSRFLAAFGHTCPLGPYIRWLLCLLCGGKLPTPCPDLCKKVSQMAPHFHKNASAAKNNLARRGI